MSSSSPVARVSSLSWGAALVGLLVAGSGCSNVSAATPTTSAVCTTNAVGNADGGGDDDDDHDDGGASTCKPGDADGVNGGCYAFAMTVDDTAFSQIILKAQNDGTVTLTLTNKGTKPHDFVVDCLATPNVQGCPAQSCFPSSAALTSIAPGATVKTSFVTPNPEGIYIFRSDVAGDSTLATDGGVSGIWGQFVIQ